MFVLLFRFLWDDQIWPRKKRHYDQETVAVNTTPTREVSSQASQAALLVHKCFAMLPERPPANENSSKMRNLYRYCWIRTWKLVNWLWQRMMNTAKHVTTCRWTTNIPVGLREYEWTQQIQSHACPVLWWVMFHGFIVSVGGSAFVFGSWRARVGVGHGRSSYKEVQAQADSTIETFKKKRKTGKEKKRNRRRKEGKEAKEGRKKRREAEKKRGRKEEGKAIESYRGQNKKCLEGVFDNSQAWARPPNENHGGFPAWLAHLLLLQKATVVS